MEGTIVRVGKKTSVVRWEDGRMEVVKNASLQRKAIERQTELTDAKGRVLESFTIPEDEGEGPWNFEPGQKVTVDVANDGTIESLELGKGHWYLAGLDEAKAQELTQKIEVLGSASRRTRRARRIRPRRRASRERRADYQGWKNYPTWNVALHLSNDEGLYDMINEWAQDSLGQGHDKSDPNAYSNAEVALADQIESFIKDSRPALEGIYGDILNSALDEVDWREIAENWLMDFEPTEDNLPE